MDYFNQGFSGSRPGGTEPFPDPFFDMASLAMPRTMPAALRWCEFIMSSQGIYRAAIERIVSYFVTDIQVVGDALSDDEKRDFREYLVDDLGVMEAVYIAGMDEACYGNSFVSVIEAFTRSLACRNCRAEFAFEVVTEDHRFNHSWSDYQFHAHCPVCRVSGPWRMIDRRGGSDGDLKIKHWSPHEIRIRHEGYGGRNRYMWVIPEDDRQKIRSGDVHALRHAPVEVIEAVKRDQNILFDEGYIHHSATQTFSGVRNRGWGISKVLTNFRQSWYVQVLHRFNEAIALDYVVPMRVITPEPSGGGGETNDPLRKLNMGGVGSEIMDMIRRHRRDPGEVTWFPFPLKYQQLGGDASQLVPHQLMDQGIDALLNSCNIPVEMYKMNLSMQAATPALRLFESTHRDKPKSYNRLLKFIINRVSRYKDWPKASCELVPVTVIDDLSKQMPKLQLMQSGMVSPQTGLSTIGLDFEEETRKSLDAQRFQQEISEEIQEEMEEAGMQKALAPPPLSQWHQQQQMAQMGGDPGMGGGDPGMGGDPGAAATFAASQPMPDSMPVDPREVLERAKTIASQLLTYEQSGQAAQKHQVLKDLRERSQLLHKAVLDEMRRLRSQAESQGRDAIMQQQFGKAAASRVRWGILGHGRPTTLRARGRRMFK